jgi:hypothetical protein
MRLAGLFPSENLPSSPQIHRRTRLHLEARLAQPRLGADLRLHLRTRSRASGDCAACSTSCVAASWPPSAASSART